MAAPLLVRLLLDAEGELLRAADAVPHANRDVAMTGLNTPGWIVAHAGFFLDAWVSADARGKALEDCDEWLVTWFEQQEASPAAPVVPSFDEAHAAFTRAVERTSPFVTSLSESALETVPANIEENGWPADTTAGYLVARAVAHLFAHAAELNVVATGAGATDIGLPGRLRHTFGA